VATAVARRFRSESCESVSGGSNPCISPIVVVAAEQVDAAPSFVFDKIFDQDASPTEILIRGRSQGVTRQALLSCLNPEGWLECEIIDAYMELLHAEAVRRGGGANVMFMPSNFLTVISRPAYNFQNGLMCVIGAPTDVFLHDLILVPVNRDNKHWLLVVVNLRSNRFQLYDPLLRTPTGHTDVRTITKWFEQLSVYVSAGRNLPMFLREAVTTMPAHSDSRSCGLYVLRYAEALSRDRMSSLTLNPSELSRIRTEIVRDLCTWTTDWDR
jgi:Ulp1 family protease